MRKLRDVLYGLFFEDRQLPKWLFVFVVSSVTVILYVSGILQRFELLTIDYRFKLRPVSVESSDIVFIDMAEDSIEAIGRWPWPRKWHATLVAGLSKYDPKVIAFDVIFSEPQDEFDDNVFAEAMERSDKVYLPLLYNLETHEIKDFSEGKGVVSVLGPLDKFKKVIKGTGHINALPDPDGILRRFPPIVEYNGKRSYQLGFRIASDLMGLDSREITFDPKSHLIFLKSTEDETRKIVLDENNQIIVNWEGGWGKVFKHYSYLDVIRSLALIKEGKKPIVDLEVFRDKICIIGLTASGLIDIKPIPIEKAYPAVGVMAFAIKNIMDHNFVYEVPRFVNVAIIFFVSVFLVFFLLKLRPLNGMIATFVGIILYVFLSLWIFMRYNMLIVTFYPIFAIFVSYVLTAAYTQILQTLERRTLFDQATRDGLTGLYNVRHFKMLLENEFKNVSKFKVRKLSLIMCDLDNFKKVNDTYGHLAGDSVLVEAANTIKFHCRRLDIVARYGGEEFIVMLIGASEENAKAVAEKIRSIFAKKRFNFKDEIYGATLSAGVVEYSSEKTQEQLIENADRALYEAKRTGKNKVCVHNLID